jgi:hypothetical protein
MGDDGWGAASDNWTGHSYSSAQNVLREEGPIRTAEVTARCIVELYELQSGILDREQQVAQPFIDQVFLLLPHIFSLPSSELPPPPPPPKGVGFDWLSQNSALLAFRTGDLAAVAVRSSGRETCLYVLRYIQLYFSNHYWQGTNCGLCLTAALLLNPFLLNRGPDHDE